MNAALTLSSTRESSAVVLPYPAGADIQISPHDIR
jgi:hypothetical protein